MVCSFVSIGSIVFLYGYKPDSIALHDVLRRIYQPKLKSKPPTFGVNVIRVF